MIDKKMYIRLNNASTLIIAHRRFEVKRKSKWKRFA